MRTLFSAALFMVLAGAATAEPLQLHRGVGLHEWLNWSPVAADQSYVWPPYRSVEGWLGQDRPASDWPAGDEFARIRKMGFDFVRLSVDPGPLLASDGDRRQQALDVLEADVKRITAVGLRVDFDLHAVSQVPAYSINIIQSGAASRGVSRYLRMVGDVTRMLAKIGADKVAIEPFNEPEYYPCTTGGHGDWQKIMTAAVATIRAISSDLTIVATGACGGDITGLVDLNPSFDDANILYSFHMYDPHSFTHQRLDDSKMFGSGLPWPPSAATPDTVIEALEARMSAAGLDAAAQAADLDVVRPLINDYFQQNWDETALENRFGEAAAWAEAHNIPTSRLYMGEFGAILMSDDGRMGAPDADRLRYLADVRHQAERYGMPWAIWEYSNPYGMTVIVPNGPADPDEELLAALGLAQ